MDYKNEYESLKQQLKDLGFDDDRLNQILDLAAEEAIDFAIQDLNENLDEASLEEISNELQKEIPNKEKAVEILNLIFEKGYGTEAESKKYEYINQYLRETVELTKNSKDLMYKYNQGDPTAVASVQSNMTNPDAQEVEKHLNTQE